MLLQRSDEAHGGSALDHVLALVAGEPEDAKDVGGDDEDGVRAEQGLEPGFGLDLVQLDDVLDEVAILFGGLIQLGQLLVRETDLSVQLGFGSL